MMIDWQDHKSLYNRHGRSTGICSWSQRKMKLLWLQYLGRMN